ncbi:MAG TPA: CDGSH iron-sulfur domain-containing protein [Steroidobacteraceae bacterium]|nr:CDGSH iron-sulfur domain-containing protein [Steroidobacteraceae bacterium]
MSEEVVRGKKVVIRFEGERCIHSRHCVLDRPDVFVPNVEGEWIYPDRATPEEVLELAHNCPSGAIRCERPDGAAMEQAPSVNTVRIRENGPLAFRAELSVNGQPQGYRLTLCRCGASSHKPYCDGSHTAAAFAASGEVAVTESKPLASRGGPLKIEPAKDGPLHVIGSLEVVTGTGKTVNRVTDAWLCRCGHSRNKPYCDGSHRAAGFRSGD